MEVRIASSGAEALEIAPGFAPHIVLCDLRLPDMPGLEVGRRLRAEPNCHNALIAIHTAFSEREIESLVSSSADVDLLVPKPLTIKQIEKLQAHWESLVRSGRINPEEKMSR
jgi:CheY-like chemotaxis protein